MYLYGFEHRGLLGYCLIYDPQNPNICLQWWPVDLIEGDYFANSYNPYKERYPLYYCAHAVEDFYRSAECIFTGNDPVHTLHTGGSNCLPCSSGTRYDSFRYNFDEPFKPWQFSEIQIRMSYSHCDHRHCCGHHGWGTLTFDQSIFAAPGTVAYTDDGQYYGSLSDNNNDGYVDRLDIQNTGKYCLCNDAMVDIKVRKPYCEQIVQVVTPLGRNKAWYDRINPGSSYLVPTLNYEYLQDWRPFGSMVPPEDIVDPRTWDFDPDTADNQPIKIVDVDYSFKEPYNVRAGSPYSCTPITRTCTYPDTEEYPWGQIALTLTPDGVDRLKRLFAESFKAWNYEATGECYTDDGVALGVDCDCPGGGTCTNYQFGPLTCSNRWTGTGVCSDNWSVSCSITAPCTAPATCMYNFDSDGDGTEICNAATTCPGDVCGWPSCDDAGTPEDCLCTTCSNTITCAIGSPANEGGLCDDEDDCGGVIGTTTYCPSVDDFRCDTDQSISCAGDTPADACAANGGLGCPTSGGECQTVTQLPGSPNLCISKAPRCLGGTQSGSYCCPGTSVGMGQNFQCIWNDLSLCRGGTAEGALCANDKCVLNVPDHYCEIDADCLQYGDPDYAFCYNHKCIDTFYSCDGTRICPSGVIGGSCHLSNCTGTQTCVGDAGYEIISAGTSIYWQPPLLLCGSNLRPPYVSGGNADYCGVAPIIENITINSQTDATIVLHRTSNINLEFTVNADPNQLPLSSYRVYWGEAEISVSGTNFRDRTNPEQPFTLSHNYSYYDLLQKNNLNQFDPEIYCFDEQRLGEVDPVTDGVWPSWITIPSLSVDSCVVLPRIQVIDNWGWCNGNLDPATGVPVDQWGYHDNVCVTEIDAWSYYNGVILIYED